MSCTRAIVATLTFAAIAACADRPAGEPQEARKGNGQPEVATQSGTSDLAAISDGTRGGTGRVPLGGEANAEGTGGPLLGMSAGPHVYLMDAAGASVYLLEGNTDGSKCDARCEQAWPPLLATESRAKAGVGLDSQLLGMKPRPDQSYQVSYGNNPLYRYAGDAGAGRTNGHGVRDQWGTWSLVGLDGKRLADPLPSGDAKMAVPADSGSAVRER